MKTAPSFAVLIPVGPSPLEPDRLVDLLDSLLVHESTGAHAVIIHDNPHAGIDTLRPLLPQGLPVTLLSSLRRGRGIGWLGGLATGVLQGLAHIHRALDVEFVVRLDTDALVIKPFASQIQALVANRKAGLLGSFREPLASAPHVETLKYIQTKFLKPFTVWRHNEFPTQVQCRLIGRGKRIARLQSQAEKHGYQRGSFCRGGAYVLTPAILEAMASQGLFSNPDTYLFRPVSEDVVATTSCFAAGLECVNTGLISNRNGGLAATPDELIAGESAIIHSLKAPSPEEEKNLRMRFREARRATAC